MIKQRAPRYPGSENSGIAKFFNLPYFKKRPDFLKKLYSKIKTS
jgi:hypothetical protein